MGIFSTIAAPFKWIYKAGSKAVDTLKWIFNIKKIIFGLIALPAVGYAAFKGNNPESRDQIKKLGNDMGFGGTANTVASWMKKLEEMDIWGSNKNQLDEPATAQSGGSSNSDAQTDAKQTAIAKANKLIKDARSEPENTKFTTTDDKEIKEAGDILRKVIANQANNLEQINQASGKYSEKLAEITSNAQARINEGTVSQISMGAVAVALDENKNPDNTMDPLSSKNPDITRPKR